MRDEFLGQKRNDPLGTAVELRRDGSVSGAICAMCMIVMPLPWT